MDAFARQQRIVASLQADPSRFPHPVQTVERIDTHISTVLLAGDFAYKIKKPLNLGFLNFLDLEQRQRYCQAELVINQRLAASVYLDVVAITGALDNPHVEDPRPDRPRMGGTRPVLEYAVRMRRFDPEQQLDRLLARGCLPVAAMQPLGTRIAHFHEDTERAPAHSPYGQPESVLQPMLDNFQALHQALPSAVPAATFRQDILATLQALETWTRTMATALTPLLAQRHASGCIRACHGDMHLGNMVYLPGVRHTLAIFDGIEFNPALRWIDVASEIAFVTMDLQARGAAPHAHALLNAYLEQRADLELLRLLPFYQVYRALVRAKVHAIHASEPALPEAERVALGQEMLRYLQLAQALQTRPAPGLLLMQGVSGSGKTYLSTAILERYGAIRRRTDTARKRLLGMSDTARPTQDQEDWLYSPAGRAAVYQQLLEEAATLLGMGQRVVIDATFLTRQQRRPFAALAERLHVPWGIVACRADAATLQTRLQHRTALGTDASDADYAIARQQLTRLEPPAEDEPAVVLHTRHPLPQLLDTLEQFMPWLVTH